MDFVIDVLIKKQIIHSLNYVQNGRFTKWNKQRKDYVHNSSCA